MMYSAFQCITKPYLKELSSKYYHYTTLDACCNILKSNDLWMSNVRYLNDSTEIQYCKKQVLQSLQTNDRTIRSDVSRNLFDYYAISLSSTPYLENQWREYANDNKGVCIEFDFKQDGLFKMLINNGLIVPQHIIYEKKQIDNLIQYCRYISQIVDQFKNEEYEDMDLNSLIDNQQKGGVLSMVSFGILQCLVGPYYEGNISMKKMESKLNKIAIQKLRAIYNQTIPYLSSTNMPKMSYTCDDIYLRLAQLLYPFAKKQDFAHEEEMRIVHYLQKSNASPNLSHRIADDLIVPYICMRDLLPNDMSKNSLLPITKIYMGAKISEKRHIQSMIDYLCHLGRSNIKVVKK